MPGKSDKVQLFGVIGLAAVALVVVVLSGVLALRGVTPPGAWEALAGGCVTALGTLVVSRTRNSGESAAIAQSLAQVHSGQRHASPYIQPTHMTPIPSPPASPSAPGAFTATIQETGLHQEG